MFRKMIKMGGLGALALAAMPAMANVTGKIDARITLTQACVVNGASQPNGATNVNMGLVDFGTQTTLFSQADAQVASTAGSGVIVQCSAGGAPVVRFLAGLNDGKGTGGGNKAMKHATATQFVTYNLYRDAGRATRINNNDAFPLLADGSQQTIPVFGRAFGAPGLIAGQYSDTVTVVLEL